MQFPEMRISFTNDIQCLSGCRYFWCCRCGAASVKTSLDVGFPIRELALMQANGTGHLQCIKGSKQAFPPRAACLFVPDFRRRGKLTTCRASVYLAEKFLLRS